MTGTPSQIEWAERIKPQVKAEFDRVANALNRVASHQDGQDRVDTQAVVAILFGIDLEEKRAEVLTQDRAGYWKMMGQDSRFQTIQANRAARSRETSGTGDAFLPQMGTTE